MNRRSRKIHDACKEKIIKKELKMAHVKVQVNNTFSCHTTTLQKTQRTIKAPLETDKSVASGD